MKRTICIGVLLALAMLVPTTASAHTLSLSGAARKAKAAAQDVANNEIVIAPDELTSDVFASRRYCNRLPLRRGSSRLSPHAVRCFVTWAVKVQDGRHAECIAAVNVRYRSPTSRRTRSRVTDVDCFHSVATIGSGRPPSLRSGEGPACCLGASVKAYRLGVWPAVPLPRKRPQARQLLGVDLQQRSGLGPLIAAIALSGAQDAALLVTRQ